MKLTGIRALLICTSAALFLQLPLGTAAAETKNPGTSDAKTRAQAAAALPYRYLRPELANVVQRIVEKPTIYRRLPIETIDCDHEMFTYLVRNPEVVVEIWRNMGVTKLSMTRRGAHSFEASDGMGTVSQFQLIHGTPKVHVYLGSGYYEGPLLKKKIRASCVLLVRSAYRRSSQGRMAITNVVDVFVDIDNGALNLAAKTLHPLFIHAADENLVTTANFLSQLSYTAEMSPNKIVQLSRQLRQVNPEVRHGFATLVQKIGQRRAAHTDLQMTRESADQSDAVNQVRYQRAIPNPSTPRPTLPKPSSKPRSANKNQSEWSRTPVTVSRFPPEYPRYR